MFRPLSITVSFLAAILCPPLFSHAEPAAASSPAPRQLIVAVAPNTETFCGTLRLFELNTAGQWIAASDSWPVLFGKNGLAWGRGLNAPHPGLQKVERDNRSPAGRFRIGFALGNESRLPSGAKNWPYHIKTENDAWIEDPTLPDYNHLVTVDPRSRPAWFQKQRLKLEDPAYHWLLVIEHNYPNSISGAGSAIFFHIRRGEKVPTAGCTTMPQERLEQILRWLDPDAHPQFVLLAEPDYLRLWKDWKLPAPALLKTDGRN